jgi:hypothetical protein
MVPHGVPWCVMVCHGVSWCVMVCHGVPWCVMVCHGVPWCAMVCHGVPCGVCCLFRVCCVKAILFLNYVALYSLDLLKKICLSSARVRRSVGKKKLPPFQNYCTRQRALPNARNVGSRGLWYKSYSKTAYAKGLRLHR